MAQTATGAQEVTRKDVVVKRVKPYMHPGMAARPFLRPALKDSRKLIIRKIKAAARRVTSANVLIQRIDRAVFAGAQLVKINAQKLAPKDTGRLRGSINVRKRGMMYYTIGTNVFYAPYQEFGVKPYKHPGVKPRTKKALAWNVKGSKRNR
jgi:hypothetical protein